MKSYKFNFKPVDQYITDHKLTNAEFGNILGVSESYVRWMRIGGRVPSLLATAVIADLIGCSLDEMVIRE